MQRAVPATVIFGASSTYSGSIEDQIQLGLASTDPNKRFAAQQAQALLNTLGPTAVTAFELNIYVDGLPYTEVDILTPNGPIEVTTSPKGGKQTQLDKVLGIAPAGVPIIFDAPNWSDKAGQSIQQTFGTYPPYNVPQVWVVSAAAFGTAAESLVTGWLIWVEVERAAIANGLPPDAYLP